MHKSLTQNVPSHATKTVVMERVILDESMLLVMSSSTSWVNFKKISADVTALNSLFQEVVTLAKCVGAKISHRNGTKKKIVQIYDAAVSDFASYQSLYEMLKHGWEQKLLKGVMVPTCEDTELEGLTQLAHRMEALTYRNTPLGMAMTLYSELSEFKSHLSHYEPAQAMGVTIYL